MKGTIQQDMQYVSSPSYYAIKPLNVRLYIYFFHGFLL